MKYIFAFCYAIMGLAFLDIPVDGIQFQANPFHPVALGLYGLSAICFWQSAKYFGIMRRKF